MMSMSVYATMMFDSICFRPLAVTTNISNSIDDPDDPGLDGKLSNLVLPPGALAIMMFVFACILLKVWGCWARKRVKEARHKEVVGRLKHAVGLINAFPPHRGSVRAVFVSMPMQFLHPLYSQRLSTFSFIRIPFVIVAGRRHCYCESIDSRRVRRRCRAHWDAPGTKSLDRHSCEWRH